MMSPGVPQSPLFPLMGEGWGLGLRPEHYAAILDLSSRPLLPTWFEALTENYLCEGGRPLHMLDQVRRDFPIALHGVALSIGSVDPLNLDHLQALKRLVSRIEPFIVSDHLCWTGVHGEHLHDLLPLPYTREAVRHVVQRVNRVQDELGRRILLENVSSYLEFEHSEMEEWEFLSEIAREADCGILLDVNNVYVSSVNHGFDPMAYLASLPFDRVGQIHLAGHSIQHAPNGARYLIDTHAHPVSDEVWALFAEAVKRLGARNTMIEWDAEIPAYPVLETELRKARDLQEKTIADSFAKKPEYRPNARSADAADFAEIRGNPELASVDHHGARRGSDGASLAARARPSGA